MTTNILKKAVDAGAFVAEAGIEAGRLKETVTQAAEDGMRAARRTVRKGREAAEDLVDDATLQIRRHPLESAGMMLALGLGLGILIGAMVTRERRD